MSYHVCMYVCMYVLSFRYIYVQILYYTVSSWHESIRMYGQYKYSIYIHTYIPVLMAGRLGRPCRHTLESHWYRERTQRGGQTYECIDSHTRIRMYVYMYVYM